MVEHIIHTTDPAEHVHLVREVRVRTPSHIIYTILNIIEILLAFRLALKLFGANAGNGLVNFLYALTGPLVAPFAGIFSSPAPAVFEWSTLIAMLAYAILAYLIVRLFSLE